MDWRIWQHAEAGWPFPRRGQRPGAPDTEPAGQQHRRRHPDGRGDQPWELRRAAAGLGRPRGGREHRCRAAPLLFQMQCCCPQAGGTPPLLACSMPLSSPSKGLEKGSRGSFRPWVSLCLSFIMTAAIYTASGTSAGVGFAIGIDTVRKVVPQLLETGKVLRPALNIQVGLFARQTEVPWLRRRALMLHSPPAEPCRHDVCGGHGAWSGGVGDGRAAAARHARRGRASGRA